MGKEVAPKKKLTPEQVQLQKLNAHHGHCADFLMGEYGVPEGKRLEILTAIDAIYDQAGMFHDLIIHGVRGYIRTPKTASLKSLLERHATKKPQHNRQPL